LRRAVRTERVVVDAILAGAKRVRRRQHRQGGRASAASNLRGAGGDVLTDRAGRRRRGNRSL